MSQRPRTLKVVTLGCSKNLVDTQHLLAQLQGYFVLQDEEYEGNSDYLLLNTCGFIGDAKEESVNAVLHAVERKSLGEVGKVIVFGCLSQRYISQMPSLIPEVDAWFGARDLAPLISFLGVTPDSRLESSRFLPDGRHSYAFLKISEGCDRRCSYCAIPFIRGAHKSVPIETLVKEAESLVASGVRELVIIAQDTTYYGIDLYHKRALADLLKELSKIDGLEWMRIHYSYPADFPDDVLEQMEDNPKVCRYMDIPLQHISDKVLDMMHRNVNGEWTRNLIRKMREKVPGVVLRTTMIVGHPGEGRKEFEELLSFVREARFERLGAFKYSEEEGTFDAGHFKDEVSEKTKQERLDELMSLQNGISFAYNQSRVGTVEKVIVDDFADGSFVCRSEFESPDVDGEIRVKYDNVKMDGRLPEAFVGKFLKVRITAAEDYDLVAEVL